MNYIKDAIDFAMTLMPVKEWMALRNQNGFFPIGINARFVKGSSVYPNGFFVRINFDYYKKDSNVPEDFYVVTQWTGNQYILYGYHAAVELDGNE